ncbi:P-loop containing nucleoside triphosphate hydrolase protein [Irpex rosettiformis]|uniref:P-loop containing nucleoside triphosphate hydrolase protein n=1 Tax=Irpex rosettiformis TaxID=378272 RepID=A0ACB8TWN7_9APHY|nr:P-loop containing nucleoside triphosphate hydrolase protein [Irpex rosettiformis]
MQPPIHEEEPLVSYHDNHEDEAEGQYNPPYDPDVTKTVRPVVLHASPPHSPPQQTLSPQQSQHGTLSLPVSIALSLPHSPVHAIATPRPTLLFAIASDDPAEVRRVLESGDASPNDDVGPQSALAFALTSGQLKNRTEMVKLLLAYGADPASVKRIGAEEDERTSANPSGDGGEENGEEAIQNIRRKSVDPLEAADPATRYYIARAEAPQTRRASALIHRSFFRPLTKVRYEMIGQDRALEQLFRVLSMPSMAPIVVLLCGPSGHGKSLLARRFGSLLDVPTHTVNMTTLRSTHDIWRSYSMSPYEVSEPSSLTLADFLLENEGKRCVVVLDEIEKTENDTILSSLLMPWELGRCSFEAGHRHVNVSKVIWLGTSNIGHDLVFEHQSSRIAPAEPMTRDEYVDLMGILRPVVSDRLGPSLLSRVTTVLPFVPFTVEEKLAIAAEALFSLAEDAATRLPAATVEKLVKDSLKSYVPAEGARSLYRAVSAQLLDTL